MEIFLNNFKSKSRHHYKLCEFIYPELKKISNADILEFGVSDKAMSTYLFLEYSKTNNCKLYSIDNVDYANKFNDANWKFILTRDDDYSKVESNIPKNFKLILLDTIHEASHVEKILYRYYDLLEINHCFFIDDISWLPYLKNAEKNRFYAEMNNHETFIRLLEIYINNKENFNIEFNFIGTGMCKITKLNKLKLNKPIKIKTRHQSFKNFLRKILKRS